MTSDSEDSSFKMPLTQLQTTLVNEGHGVKMPAELYNQQRTEMKQEVLQPNALLFMTAH